MKKDKDIKVINVAKDGTIIPDIRGRKVPDGHRVYALLIERRMRCGER